MIDASTVEPMPEPDPDADKGPEPDPDADDRPRRARITWACEIEAEPVVWAWKEDDAGRIPSGSLSVAAGREGTGKSSFGIWKTAHVTQGTLPGSFYGTPRRVFYVAMEDSWKYTLVPRLIAAGADLSMVGRFEVVSIDDEELTLSLPHDNALLEQEVDHHGIALVYRPLLASSGRASTPIGAVRSARPWTRWRGSPIAPVPSSSGSRTSTKATAPTRPR